MDFLIQEILYLIFLVKILLASVNDKYEKICAVPSNCEIDSSGKCKWFLKQIEVEGKNE